MRLLLRPDREVGQRSIATAKAGIDSGGIPGPRGKGMAAGGGGGG